MASSSTHVRTRGSWIALCTLIVVSSTGPFLPTAQGQLADDVLKKAKRATVHLNIKAANGETYYGSGWFIERGLIITNAHVLNMHGGDKRQPSKIEVVIDSGEKTSRTVTAKFRGAAYESDLMLLKVEGDVDNLPEPLTVNPDAELKETQVVYGFGFPLGKVLGKNITVSKFAITSLRKENDVLREIQFDGGLHAGNSGGPIVNQEGEVIGVAVSAIDGTTINFAIPPEPVSQLVNGKFLNLKLEQAALENGLIKIPMRVQILDPLNRIKDVKIEYWTTPDASPTPRPGSWTKPEPLEGDGPLQTAEATERSRGVPTIDLLVPPLADDKSRYWFRASFIDGRGRTYWSPATGNIRPAPLDQRGLAFKFKTTAGPGRALQITNEGTFKVKVGTRSQSLVMLVRVNALPTLFATDANGDTRAKLRYNLVTLGMRRNGEPVENKEKWTPLGQNLLKTSADIRYSDEGAVVFAQPDLRKADPKFKDELVGISDLVMQSLELLTIPLPQQTVEPKHRVRLQKMLLVGLPEMYVPAQADVKYQYMGVRRKEEGEVAIFDLTAELWPRRGDGSRVNGKLTGALEVLVETGELVYGHSNINVDLELPNTDGMQLVGNLVIHIAPAPPLPATKSEK